MQLECLLRSIKDQAPDLFEHIIVQFVASSESYMISYQRLAMEIFEWDTSTSKQLTFIPEKVRGGFKKSFEENVDDKYSYTCLLVDDDIFFNPIVKENVIEVLRLHPIVSLRLGKNITNPIHFKYNGSLDGNIFPTKLVRKVFTKDFKNPNQLEVAMVDISKSSGMAWFETPKLIGIPANRVSETSRCSYMSDNTKELLERYNNGFRIDYRSMDLDCDNVHKEEPYKYFKKL